MKNSGLFLNMAKWCFLGLFFWGFNVIVVCFWCVWHSSKSVKNACFFPSFLGFCGVAYSCLFGFGRFRCFCVSCVCFFFLCCFCFCFVCFVFVLLLDCFLLVLFCFCFFFFFFLFLFFFVFFFFFFFFGGFKGQVRWPKGPPHLALNPPLFFVFLFFFFVFLCFFFFLFFFLFFLEGLRVRWGGPKGHLTWP